jgi:hypothetical protein
MDNVAAFHNNFSRYFLYHDIVAIVNSMVKISFRWDRHYPIETFAETGSKAKEEASA